MRTLSMLLAPLCMLALSACSDDEPASAPAADSSASSDIASSDVTSTDVTTSDVSVSDTTAVEDTAPPEDTAGSDTAPEVSSGADVTGMTDATTSDAVTPQDATAGDATPTETTDSSSASDAAPSLDATPDAVADVAEDAAVVDPCEECLANGGTWQPPAGCTQDCNIADLSCFTSECPEPCSADACGSCFDQEDCEASGCTWNAEGPAMWCN